MYSIKLLSTTLSKCDLSRQFQTRTFTDCEIIGINQVATIGNYDGNELSDYLCDLSNMDSFCTTNYDGTFTLYEYVLFDHSTMIDENIPMPIACSGSVGFDFQMWVDTEYIGNNIIGLHTDDNGNPYYISETYRRYEIAEIAEFNSLRKKNAKTFDIMVILYMNPDDDIDSPIVDYYFGASCGLNVDDIKSSVMVYEKNHGWIA